MKKLVFLCCTSIAALHAMEESALTLHKTNHQNTTTRISCDLPGENSQNNYWDQLHENIKKSIMLFAAKLYKDKAMSSPTQCCLQQLVTQPVFLSQFVRWLDKTDPEQAKKIFHIAIETRDVTLTKVFCDFGYCPDHSAYVAIPPQLVLKKTRIMTWLKQLPFEEQVIIACLAQQDQAYIKNAPVPNKLKTTIALLKKTVRGEHLFGELLLEAIRIGNKEALESIMTQGSQYGLTINYCNQWGETPLLFAARYNRADFLSYFISLGADINAKNHAGCTALMVASWCGYKHIVKLLINAGAEIRASSLQGWTALTAAVQKNHKAIAELLVKKSWDTLSDKTDLMEMDSEITSELIKLPITSWATHNKVCSQCSKEQSDFVCCGCQSVYYCSKECQIKQWPYHQLSCKN